MLKIYTIAVNRPDFLLLQHRTFYRFLADPYQLIVINDGKGEDALKIGNMARRLELDHHNVERPRRDTANYAHARSIQWAYDNFISKDDDVSVLLDGDMFLGAKFSVRDWLGNHALAGIPQNREHVRYIWPGLVFMNMRKLPDKRSLSFWPDVVDGQRVDVGGHSHEYLRDHPWVEVRWIQRDASDKGCIRTQEQFLEAKRFGMEIALSFLHYRCGTNWDHQSADHHTKKTELLNSIFAELMP